VTGDLSVEVTVNGRRHEASVDPRRTLADFIRDDLGLTGTHLGCEHGVCGACTVLLDGASARSCLVLVGQASGHEVETIEGVAGADGSHPLLEAFRSAHSFQCGFCTPGFVMTAIELLAGRTSPTEAEIRSAISGNLCRCTGYQSIVDGMLLAVAARR
jgi:aerobic-type carbon monoxide dehydrogenase small subunit (CoxS/CutS family)